MTRISLVVEGIHGSPRSKVILQLAPVQRARSAQAAVHRWPQRQLFKIIYGDEPGHDQVLAPWARP